MARFRRLSLYVCVALAGVLLAVALTGCGGYGGGGGKTNTGNTSTGGGY
jgi:hypothetical protein